MPNAVQDRKDWAPGAYQAGLVGPSWCCCEISRTLMVKSDVFKMNNVMKNNHLMIYRKGEKAEACDVPLLMLRAIHKALEVNRKTG